MTIALTYDLRSDYADQGFTEEQLAEFDFDDTIEAIEASLIELGHQPIRVGNLFKLVKALAANQHREWDCCFNIAEGWHGSARESQVAGLLEAYQVPFVFSDARVLCMVHDKAITKTVLQHHGVVVSPFAVISHQDTFKPLSRQDWGSKLSQCGISCDPFEKDMPALFVKPCSEGTSRGIYNFSRTTSAEETNEAIVKLRAMFPQQDLLVELFLDGREFTVSITGEGNGAEIIGTTEIVWRPGSTQFYTYEVKFNGGHSEDECIEKPVWSTDTEVAKVESLALCAWRVLGCRGGGRVDLRSQGWGVNARPCVMEVRAVKTLKSCIDKINRLMLYLDFDLNGHNCP